MTNAVTYAETELGVHACHKSALEARELLEKSLDELGTSRAALREAEFDLSFHEVEMLTDQMQKHPEMSATAMKDHIKRVTWSDSAWLEVRQLIDLRKQQVEQAETDVRLAENDVRIACARMTELGGYLDYLAVAKANQVMRATPEKPEKTEQTGQTA